jgi:propanol-preferring alcohol dehydrogenase
LIQVNRSSGRAPPKVPVKTSVQIFALEQANEALDALRQGRVSGAAVLLVR